MISPDTLPDPDELHGYERAAAIAARNALLYECALELVTAAIEVPAVLDLLNSSRPEGGQFTHEALQATRAHLASRVENERKSTADCLGTAMQQGSDPGFIIA